MKFSRNTTIYRLIFLIGMYIASVEATFADWINVTGAAKSPNIAEVHVNENKIKLILEIDPNDLETFVKDSKKQNFNLPEFIVDGKMLVGNIQLQDKRKRIERKSKLPSFTGKTPSNEVHYLEIVYPFEKLPQQLEILAPKNEQGIMSTIIGFVVFHKSIPVIDFRYLPKKSVLHLNWKDPWYSAFEHRNLTRHHKFPLMSFLYIEPFEVRHEFLIRLKDLQPWLRFDFSDRKIINQQQQQYLRQSIGELVLKHNPVLISGKPVRPALERVEFVKVSREGIKIRKEAKSVDVSTATIGVIISHITQGIPDNVSMTWDMFSKKITRIPLRIKDPAGHIAKEITPEDNVISWDNRLKNYTLPKLDPVVVQGQVSDRVCTILLISCAIILLVALIKIRTNYIRSKPLGLNLSIIGIVLIVAVGICVFRPVAAGYSIAKDSMTLQQGKIIIVSLLKNIYRALEFKKEDDIYDRLQVSVAGDLLEKLYLQRKHAMKMQLEGDVNVKLKELGITSLKLEKNKSTNASYIFHCRWKVLGSLGHWGHMHNRHHVYEAMLTIKPLKGTWKITNIEWILAKKVASS